MNTLDRATQPLDLTGWTPKPDATVSTFAPLPGPPQRRVPVAPNMNQVATRTVASAQSQADYAVKRMLTKPAALAPSGSLTPIQVNNTPQTSGLDLVSGPRPYGRKGHSKGEYVTLPASGTVSILNITGSGYVDSLWVGIPVTSNITVTVDGATAYSGPSQNFFAGVYADSQPAFCTKWFIGNSAAAGGGGVGYASAVAIPFGTSINISLTETTGVSKTIFYEIGYQLGLALTTWDLTRRLHVVSGVANPAAYSIVSLLNVIPNVPGRLAGVYFVYDAFPGSVSPATAPLEGNFTISNETGVVFESSGTEDYLQMSDFFNGFAQNSSGMDCALTVKTSVTWGGYRMHFNDPITFNSALSVTWAAGEVAHAPYTGTPRFFWTVWYYTQS